MVKYPWWTVKNGTNSMTRELLRDGDVPALYEVLNGGTDGFK